MFVLESGNREWGMERVASFPIRHSPFPYVRNDSIRAALSCIHDNACRGISVKQVIRQTQRVSHVTFHRRFQEVVGKSPAEAIRERKLQEVRRLLTATELPVAMIADLCGFRTPKELARSFRAAENTTPRDYRNMKVRGIGAGKIKR